MHNSYPYSKLRYEHEVLWARYEIREHYLKTIVRNIYENVGQVLSLVRVQLSMLHFEKEPERISTDNSGELIGQVIRDLRSMCRNFYPETELLEKEGFIQALRSQLIVLEMQEQQLILKGAPYSLGSGREAILFRILQEMLLFLNKQGYATSLKIVYGKAGMGIILTYSGEPMANRFLSETTANAGLSRLSLTERAQLIGAAFSQTGKNSNIRIKLIVPLKPSVYE